MLQFLLIHFTQYCSLYIFDKMMERGGDNRTYRFTSGMFTSITIIFASWYYQCITRGLFQYYGLQLLMYYTIDSLLYLFSSRQDVFVYVTQNIIALKIITFHLHGLLPIEKGIRLCLLFEYSNVFFYMLQYCKDNRWLSLTNALIYPFALIYVPIRMIAIPIYTLGYYDSIIQISKAYEMCSVALCFIAINIVSIYNSVVVIKKFIKLFHN